ncbi:MAG: GldM family protein [Flavobacteriales bacterium]
MSAEKLSPRQQMIGIMYLVLLAMLAMNASKDLLNAFVQLENGIGSTNKNFAAKNDKAYQTIANAAAKISNFKKFNDAALEIKKQADALFKMIEEDKTWLITESGGVDEETKIPLGKDNQDLGATYYLTNDVPNDKGDRLKKGMIAFHKLLTKDLMAKGILKGKEGNKMNDQALIDRVSKMLATRDTTDADDVKHEWISMIAEHIPLAAVTANLTLLQTNIRNSEAEVIEKLTTMVEGEGMRVNVANGMAVLNPAYVLVGDDIKGEVFIAAYNNQIVPKIYVGVIDTTRFTNGVFATEDVTEAPLKTLFKSAYDTIPVSGGKGMFKKKAGSPGQQDIMGVIRIPDKDGVKYFSFKSSYMVAEPTATVAATKMNVFYVGVPNPIAVSAPGVALDDIQVAAAGLTITNGPKKGEYVVNAKTPNPKGVEVTVSKKGGGRLGGMVFRVKTLPDPVAEVMQQRGGMIPSAKLKVVSTVIAKMDNFDFDLKVTVVSFDLTMNLKGDLRTLSSTSENLTNDMKSLLSAANKGTKVYFENIKAKMPDGSIRKLGTIALTAN